MDVKSFHFGELFVPHYLQTQFITEWISVCTSSKLVTDRLALHLKNSYPRKMATQGLIHFIHLGLHLY